MRFGTVLARPSRSDENSVPHIFRDPATLTGKSCTPMMFKDRREARKYATEHGLEAEGYVPLHLGMHRPSGRSKSKKVLVEV